MSSSAFAPRSTHLSGLDINRARLYRKTRKTTVTYAPWNSVSLAAEDAASSKQGQNTRPPSYVWALAALALVIHASLAWYLTHHVASTTIKPKHEVSVEIVPPKPPEPKIEPPKPAPPKPQQIPKPAQLLPPIQTAAPAPSNTPAVASTEPPIAVAPSVSAPVEAAPAPITPPVGRAGYLNNPPPEYPAAAARAGWDGIVKLHVHVLSNGKVDAVEVQKSSGRKVLDDEAVRTVKNWTFTPAQRGDTPVDGWANVPIEFKLDQ
jgi:protein TonB